MQNRMLRINENIQRELSQIIAELISWEGVLVTITHVDTQPDLRQATVWVSVLNTIKPQEAVDLLNKRSWDIYKALSPRLIMKRTPHLIFSLDIYIEDTTRMEELFEAIREEGDSAT